MPSPRHLRDHGRHQAAQRLVGGGKRDSGAGIGGRFTRDPVRSQVCGIGIERDGEVARGAGPHQLHALEVMSAEKRGTPPHAAVKNG
jgi:hypothetical protein